MENMDPFKLSESGRKLRSISYLLEEMSAPETTPDDLKDIYVGIGIIIGEISKEVSSASDEWSLREDEGIRAKSKYVKKRG